MQELLQQLLHHARGMWRFRTQGVLAAWAVCLVGWVVVIALPPKYEASARVYVDTSAVLRPLLQGIAVEQDVIEQLVYVRQALLSAPQLERVMRETDLDLAVETPLEREKMIAQLREDIAISAAAEQSTNRNRRSASDLFTITYTDSTPKDALAVVRALVTAFVEDSLGGKRSGAEKAERFLQDQVQEYGQRLTEAEGKIAEFKRRNVGKTGGGDFFARLQTSEDAVQRVQGALNIAVNRRAELQRQLKGEQAVLTSPNAVVGGAGGATAAAGVTTMTSVQIQETEQRLQDLLTRYTEKHPDVISAQETLRHLKARQQQEVEEMRRSAAAGQSVAGLTANPVYQQIQAQLNQVNVEIAALQSELNLHSGNVAQLRELMDTAPELEAEYVKLVRDYDVIKAQYNELVSRLDRARISEEAEQTGVVRFEVIDPPTVKTEPVAPNRPRLVLLVMLTGLLVGAGITFLLNQLSPVFDDPRTLAEATGVPVLGVVSRTWRERHAAERKREIRRVAFAGTGLLVVFGIVLALQGPVSRALHALV